ncbi:CDC27 family isoform 1 [Chlorella sorokiniana]|uniref:CDC27 family isoform 1 n=1 Tax=Chlorella sorokiniana TaxID=3076 RepID=A0A2P6TSI2_CHLSO|nr:CDC27 family isoform 1 [Chlorella sorokiniana]|eukprot:PRW57027.1 CDC27 family isoform 1 [Chlorella sorokiniana]
MQGSPGPPSAALEEHLVACVQHSLALGLHDNAAFLAERLVAQFPSEANLLLLATCYHRANQSYRAYHLLKGLPGEQSRYLFALCAMQLGKLTEAESALLPDNDAMRVPNGGAGFYLLGRIHQLSNRHSTAIAYYSTALQADPMLWSAFEELCALGADHEAQQFLMLGGGTGGPAAAASSRLFSSYGAGPGTAPGAAAAGAAAGVGSPSSSFAPVATPSVAAPHHGPGSPSGPAPMSTAATKTGLGAMFSWMDSGRQRGGDRGAASMEGGTPSPGSYVTPSPGGRLSAPPPPAPKGAGAGAARPAWPATTSPAPLTLTMGGGLALPSTGAPGPQRKFVDEGKMRKVSGKLFAEPASVLKQLRWHGGGSEGGGGSSSGAAAEGGGGGGSLADMAALPGVPRGRRSPEGQVQALPLLQSLGEGYRLLCMYRCQEAVDAFSRLPAHHYQTGWVLCCVGRAFFEMVDYPEAAKAFNWARQVDPYRLKGLEVYSTVLWHCKREVELAQLAQVASSLDRHSPYAWCVLGNCFSLQKEHETALRYFQRALQLDPTLPYAYTLAGHEYFANEDFEKGITCYRNAIRIDPRHYNAWFGMGHIYYRQEKYGMAEYHFRRALQINERSSVLRCYLGMALHKLKRNKEALDELGQAIAADPRNPLAKFERATVLMAEERYRDALAELHALKDIAPREASVLFHMGKIYKKLDMLDEAMACFANALDLQPPSADTNLIKSAIEKLRTPDDNEEEEI